MAVVGSDPLQKVDVIILVEGTEFLRSRQTGPIHLLRSGKDRQGMASVSGSFSQQGATQKGLPGVGLCVSLAIVVTYHFAIETCVEIPVFRTGQSA